MSGRGSNDSHLVVETPGANLIEAMKWFFAEYSPRLRLVSFAASGPFALGIVLLPKPVAVHHFLVNTITQSRTIGGTGGCHLPWSSALIWPSSVSLPVEALNKKPW